MALSCLLSNRALPDATIVHRGGEINAFVDPNFAAAVEATGRKKLLIAGISTKVCVGLAALSVRRQNIWH